MSYAHSLDLRSRIISAVLAGASAREAARRFEVSASSAIKLVRRWRETGSYAPAQMGGYCKRMLLDWFDWLHSVMATEPDITLAELQRRLAREGVAVSLQTINVTLRDLGYSYKKNRACGGTRARRRRAQTPLLAQPADLAEAGTSCLH